MYIIYMCIYIYIYVHTYVAGVQALHSVRFQGGRGQSTCKVKAAGIHHSASPFMGRPAETSTPWKDPLRPFSN